VKFLSSLREFSTKARVGNDIIRSQLAETSTVEDTEEYKPE
jgi:hypothetical protein